MVMTLQDSILYLFKLFRDILSHDNKIFTVIHNNIGFLLALYHDLGQPLGSMVTLLSKDQEVPGSIPGSAIGFFSRIIP